MFQGVKYRAVLLARYLLLDNNTWCLKFSAHMSSQLQPYMIIGTLVHKRIRSLLTRWIRSKCWLPNNPGMQYARERSTSRNAGRSLEGIAAARANHAVSPRLLKPASTLHTIVYVVRSKIPLTAPGKECRRTLRELARKGRGGGGEYCKHWAAEHFNKVHPTYIVVARPLHTDCCM